MKVKKWRRIPEEEWVRQKKEEIDEQPTKTPRPFLERETAGMLEEEDGVKNGGKTMFKP